MTLSLQQHKIQCCKRCQIKTSKKCSDDVPFFYISILWPSGLLTISSVLFLGIAFLYLNNNDHNTGWKSDGVNYFHSFGKKYFTCIENTPYEHGMWPSFLRQTQINYWANIYLRISILAPMPLRIFFVFIVRSYKETENPQFKNSNLYNFVNDIIPFVAAIEILSQALFSVLTIRFDSASFYEYAFTIFAFTSVIYMCLRTFLLLATFNKTEKYIDILSITVKFITTTAYSCCILNVFPTHIKFINTIECHAYVNKNEAVFEYFMVASYLLFHLTLLIDVRKVKFLCYSSDSEDYNEKNDIKLIKEGSI